MKPAQWDGIKQSLLAECEEDFTALWKVHWEINHALGQNFDREKAREMTMELVEFLLDSGRVEAGDPTAEGKWVPWGLSKAAAMARIESEWDSLGADPDSGTEIVWFYAPAKKNRA